MKKNIETNGILFRTALYDVVSVMENNQPCVYAAFDTRDLAVGENLSLLKPHDTWRRMDGQEIVPLLKQFAITCESAPSKKTSWENECAKKLYDYYIDQEERESPANIRKIMSSKGAYDCLNNLTLKFSPPSEFNDIQEGFAIFPDSNDTSILKREYNLKKDLDRYCICCFSEGPWNNLALSLYGNMGDGVILVFKREELEKKMNAELIPIKYRFNPPQIDPSNVEYSAFTALQSKHIPWEYEREWRFIIKREILEAKSHTLYREGSASLLMPYREEDLRGIIIGPRVNEYFKKKLIAKIRNIRVKNKRIYCGIILPRSEGYNSLGLSFC